MKVYINKKLSNLNIGYKKTKSNILINISNKTGLLNIILKLKKNSYVLGSNYYFLNHSDSRNFLSNLNILTKRLTGGHLSEIKLVGLGYTVYKVRDSFIFDLGLSHFITVKLSSKFKLEIDDKIVMGYGFMTDKITDYFSQIKRFKKLNKYTGTGILSKNQKVILKEGKVR